LDPIWDMITEAVAMTSLIRCDGRVFTLAVETLDDGRSEWTLQYEGHYQRSDIASTLSAAMAAAKAATLNWRTADGRDGPDTACGSAWFKRLKASRG
jgi:hypothetical protein